MTIFIRHLLLWLILLAAGACSDKGPEITGIESLSGGKIFAVPTGTVADQKTLERFPDARITYYNNVQDCALAVAAGKADAAVYDLPVLMNIAAKNQEVTVLNELLFPDKYGFAVQLKDTFLKSVADETLSEIKSSGIYQEMESRWFPRESEPGPLPLITAENPEGVLRFGTAAVTEPMSYIGISRQPIGFDIEFAARIAARLNKKLEIIDMEFGAMLPALISGKVDMIGAGLSITEERAKSVLFTDSYYDSGIAALVRKSSLTGAAITGGETDTVHDGRKHYKTLGVLLGTVYDAYAHKNYPDSEILTYNTVPDLLLALGSGKVDGIFIDQAATKEIFAQNQGLIIGEGNLFDAPIAAGFSKKRPDLREQFNRFLAEIKANGIYAAMENRWMNEDQAVMPDIPVAVPASGVLRAGIVSDVGLPFTAKSNQQLLGFDIELASRFAAFTGMEIRFVDLPFGSLIASLVSGRIDLITASMMITEERQKQIDFSDPYYASPACLVIRGSATTENEMALAGNTIVAGESGAQHKPANTFAQKLAESFRNNILLENRYMLILKGLWVTVLISVFAAITGTFLGGLICFMRMSKNRLLNSTARVYISLIRGTPVLVLLMITYYIIFASFNINPVLVAIIAFGFNFAAYVSEMFRTSIESIDPGQKEAGIASGFSGVQTFIHILFPQAMRRVLPVYKGEFISMVKMTSVVGYIAVQDLTKASDIIRSRTFDAFFPLIMAAVIYIIIAWILTRLLDQIEINSDPKRRRIKLAKELST